MMKHTCQGFFAVVILGMFSSFGVAQMPAVAEKAIPKLKLTDAQIAKLVENLGAEKFLDRETAMEQLRKVGKPAVPLITKAAKSGDLEVTLRSLKILESLFTKGTIEEFEAAEAALETLSQTENRTLASRAETVLGSMSDAREQRAIAAIKRFKGSLQTDVRMLGFAPARSPDGKDHFTTAIINKRWEGKVEGLKHLEQLRYLRTVYLVEGVFTEKTITQLEAKMPNIKVQLRGGACLGVGGVGVQDGCQISLVNPGSAAAKAGLREGDVIVAFNGKSGEKKDEVLDFDRLVQLIKECDAGDKVPVSIRRNGVVQTVDVVMGEWGI